jgi:hypothetical protein
MAILVLVFIIAAAALFNIKEGKDEGNWGQVVGGIAMGVGTVFFLIYFLSLPSGGQSNGSANCWTEWDGRSNSTICDQRQKG